MINIVTTYKICQFLKQSRYFRVNLGLATTTSDRSGERVLNQEDDFAYSYNMTYRCSLLGQGNIGQIKIYTDPYINEDVVALYKDKEEFVFNFDKKIIDENGIDFYLGHLIKNSEEEYQHRQDEIERKKKEDEMNKRPGDANLIGVNPGAVTYEDLKAYMENKRASRLS